MGSEMCIRDSEDTATFVARVSPRSRVHIGDDIDLVIDAARFHFFDFDNGQSLR